ncbi:MAG: competence protein ComEC [Bacteroidia bacterium]|jgi:competence protein ComEC
MTATTQARAPILSLLLGLLLGLILARHYSAPLALLLCVACISSFAALRLAGNERLRWQWMLCFLISTTHCCWAYGQLRLPKSPEAYNLTLPAREAQLTIEIQRVMQPGERYGKPSGLARVLDAPTTSRLHPGEQIYFKLTLPAVAAEQAAVPTIQRGLQLQTTGVLTPILPPPASGDEDDFEAYLQSIGVHYRFDRTGPLQILRAPRAFDRFCFGMNQRFQATLRLGSAANSDLANVYVAMLLGRKIELSKAQIERYRMTGTMHFFAISGLHIGVIATVIAQFLLLIRVPRTVAPWIGLPLLYLYVEITGGSPSAIRAFLMAAFFWSSFACQRQRSPLSALMCSAIFVLIIDPNQLWSLGFQLSYTVVLSILLFGLPLHQVLTHRCQPYQWLPEQDWNARQRAYAWSLDKFLLLFAISFSAWLASTPLSAGLFEFVAPGAILLNMLLVYLAAIVISGGVISLACASALLTGLAGFVNHSAWTVIYLMDTMIIYCAQLPGAILPSEGFSTALSYSALCLYFATLLWLHRSAARLQSHAMWLPPLIIISIVATGLAVIN